MRGDLSLRSPNSSMSGSKQAGFPRCRRAISRGSAGERVTWPGVQLPANEEIVRFRQVPHHVRQNGLLAFPLQNRAAHGSSCGLENIMTCTAGLARLGRQESMSASTAVCPPSVLTSRLLAAASIWQSLLAHPDPRHRRRSCLRRACCALRPDVATECLRFHLALATGDARIIGSLGTTH